MEDIILEVASLTFATCNQSDMFSVCAHL